jgi:acetolactate decarboxylase
MRSVFIVATAVFLALGAGSALCGEPRDVLFQCSTIDALFQGLYDGEVTFGELRSHGDFGLGTFHRLDGEMVGLEGRFFQVRADGSVHPVPDTAKTPFAAVTFFEPDLTLPLRDGMSLAEVEEHLDACVPTKNIFYAVAIEGLFRYVKTRSVPAQTKPYPLLRDVAASQPTFSLSDVRGTMVGFRCPSYVKGVNVPGYHFHFIDEGKSAGGHVLEIRTGEATARVDFTSGFALELPAQRGFYELDLSGDMQRDVRAAER